MACKIRLLSYTHILTSGAANCRKVLKLAPTSGLRAVAINRQDYPHVSVLRRWTRNDGYRIRHRQSYIFVKSIQRHTLPPILGDCKTGCVALVGWSLGNIMTCAAISSAERLSPGVKCRLAKYLRALVLQGTWY